MVLLSIIHLFATKQLMVRTYDSNPIFLFQFQCMYNFSPNTCTMENYL